MGLGGTGCHGNALGVVGLASKNTTRCLVVDIAKEQA